MIHPNVQEALDKALPALKYAQKRISALEARIRQLEATPDGGWFLAWETADKDRQELRARVEELERLHRQDQDAIEFNGEMGQYQQAQIAGLQDRVRELEATEARLREALEAISDSACGETVCCCNRNSLAAIRALARDDRETRRELGAVMDECSRFREALEMIVGDDPGCVYGKELECAENETVKTEWCVWCIARAALEVKP